MMTVFRASINCPTDGLLLDPQCKSIAPNVFSSVSWFKIRVSRILNFFSSFSCLHRCCKKPPSMCRRGMNLFTFFVENGPALYFTNSILPVFQVLTRSVYLAAISWSWHLEKGVFSEIPNSFKALTLLAPMLHTVTITSSPAFWQTSRTSIKKLTSTSLSVLPWIM